ncbi:MAG: class I SAM-dependent methyltransferase [Roseiflexaceae bacterium]|nr:class I SAM-dependent methyltransferase [Roseiflexaceae bacterium]
MYDPLIPLLRCLVCQSSLTLRDVLRDSHQEIMTGTLVCAGCAAHYPVHHGIADFLGPPRPPSIAQFTNELTPTAWAYERLWRPHSLTLLSGEAFPYERELALVTNWVAPERSGLIIDLACSNGLYARTLAPRLPAGGQVVGVDHSMPMLVEARQRAAALGLAISYIRAKAQRLPFEHSSAAAVTIGGSLNEIGDLVGCLNEVRRVLNPSGRFVAMTLTRHPRRFERAIQQLLAPSGIRFWQAADLVAQFATQHLQVVDQRQYGIVLFTLARVTG